MNIGRDIIDEYLYLNKAHIVNLEDKNLQKLILNFINTIDFWYIFLKKKKIKAIILSHVNVRLLAIVGKIATKYFNIPVYSVTSRYIKQNFNLEDHKEYIYGEKRDAANLFSQLDYKEKQNGIDWAKDQLNKRFSGEVGVDMFYSNESAFDFE